MSKPTVRQLQRQHLLDVAEVRWRNDPDWDPRSIDPAWVPPGTTWAAGQDLADACAPIRDGFMRLVDRLKSALRRRADYG